MLVSWLRKLTPSFTKPYHGPGFATYCMYSFLTRALGLGLAPRRAPSCHRLPTRLGCTVLDACCPCLWNWAHRYPLPQGGVRLTRLQSTWMLHGGFWSDALFLDCEHRRTDGWGLSHIKRFGDGVGYFAASRVYVSDMQVKGLQGALVVWLLAGGRLRYCYCWQYTIVEYNDWHWCWKGFELQYSLLFSEPWWQWLDDSM